MMPVGDRYMFGKKINTIQFKLLILNNMKTLKYIACLVIFLFFTSGLNAQQRCKLTFTDATPHTPYKAYIVVYYDSQPESPPTTEVEVYLNQPNYLPFSILEDCEDPLYTIHVHIIEANNDVHWEWSNPFNTDYWIYNDIKVDANY